MVAEVETTEAAVAIGGSFRSRVTKKARQVGLRFFFARYVRSPGSSYPLLARALRTKFFPLASKRHNGQVCVRGNVTAAAGTCTMLSSLIRVLALDKQGGFVIIGKFIGRINSDHMGSFAVVTPELFFQYCTHRHLLISDYVAPAGN